jgi:type IV secretion system protein VirB9
MMLAMLALAAPQAMFQPSDPRIQTLTYNAGQVVTLSVAQGYATVVELLPEERVDTVVVGNSAGWQVTAARAGDRIVVKPLQGATTTNLVVITDAHRYAFLLQPGDGGMASPFIVRFTLPADPRSDTVLLAQTRSFRLSGDKGLFPLEMSGDGQRTRIRWKANAPLPAIFAGDAHGKETLVNGRMVDGVYVVEGAAKRYTFRIGRRRAVATAVTTAKPQ